MLNKSISYKALLRIVGILFIAFGLYCALSIIFSPLEADSNLSRTLLDILWFRGPYVYGGNFSYGGMLIYVGLGLFFLGLSSMRVTIAYWSMQVAVWLIGINLWYQQNGQTDVQLVPVLATPVTFWPQMVITLICSLLLFALYIPLTRLLKKLFDARDEIHQQALPS